MRGKRAGKGSPRVSAAKAGKVLLHPFNRKGKGELRISYSDDKAGEKLNFSLSMHKKECFFLLKKEKNRGIAAAVQRRKREYGGGGSGRTARREVEKAGGLGLPRVVLFGLTPSAQGGGGGKKKEEAGIGEGAGGGDSKQEKKEGLKTVFGAWWALGKKNAPSNTRGPSRGERKK